MARYDCHHAKTKRFFFIRCDVINWIYVSPIQYITATSNNNFFISLLSYLAYHPKLQMSYFFLHNFFLFKKNIYRFNLFSLSEPGYIRKSHSGYEKLYLCSILAREKRYFTSFICKLNTIGHRFHSE